MQINPPSYYQYWGKTKKSDEGDEGKVHYHLLCYHSLDVAAVGRLLLDETRPFTIDVADFLDLSPNQLQNIVVFFLPCMI